MPPTSFTFADFFSGVGGFRVGLEAAGGRCVFSCEYCKFARSTYCTNFPGSLVVGDIKNIHAAQVPRHDVLAAGFPCQSFSNAGRVGAFDDARGALFYHLVRIIRACRPRALLLENVRGLMTNEAALAEVLRALKEAGYGDVEFRLLDAASLLPQRRKRVYFVAFRDPAARAAFHWPALPELRRSADEVLQYALGTSEAPPSAGLTLPLSKWARIVRSAYYQKFCGARVLPANALSQTLQATYKSGYLVYSQFVPQAGTMDVASAATTMPCAGEVEAPEEAESVTALDTEVELPSSTAFEAAPAALPPPPRFFSPRECARLMGFPEAFQLPTAPEGIAYRQLGNAVVPPLIAALGFGIARALGSSTHAARGTRMAEEREDMRCLAMVLELVVASAPAERPPRHCWLPSAVHEVLCQHTDRGALGQYLMEGSMHRTTARVSGAAYHEEVADSHQGAWHGPCSLLKVLEAARIVGGALSTRTPELALPRDPFQPSPTLPTPANATKAEVAAPCMRRWMMSQRLLHDHATCD